jgi:hypothetical protein
MWLLTIMPSFLNELLTIAGDVAPLLRQGTLQQTVVKGRLGDRPSKALRLAQRDGHRFHGLRLLMPERPGLA